MHRRRLLPLLLLAALVATAACSKNSNPDAEVVAVTTTEPSAFYPLTGLPVDDPATATRPALSLKIDNVPAAKPQIGVNDADVVYEEVVEGNFTRLLAVFQSRNADPVGPVRSVRPTDPSLVAPFGGLFGYSGGTDRFIAMIRETPGIVDVGVGSVGGAYPRRGAHGAPHNQYTSTQKLYAAAPPGLPPPPAFSPFLRAGQPFAPPGVLPAANVTIPFGGTTARWDWDGAAGLWKRVQDGRPDVLEDGNQISATTVVVQFTSYVPVPGATDVTGAQVFDADLSAGGEAWILAGGQVLKGRWAKPAETSVISYTDGAGSPVAIPPGRTWVEMPETGRPVITA